MKFSVPALLALAGVAVLALFPLGSALAGPQMGPDRATPFFLFLCAAIAQIPSLFARLSASRDASTWVFICVFFVLFHIADRAGPGTGEGWALTFPFAPDDPVPISYATRIVVLGALACCPLWLRRGGPEKSIVSALLLAGAFGLGTLWFLGQYFPVGSDKVLVPRPVTTLLVQIVAYGALAGCCRALAEHERVRAWVLRALPLILLIVMMRHQLSPIPAPKEDE